jgi:2-polyprenyl-3-methyl-5-hydroxy-6-metoxy-1,4-benzoquinol methylase
MIVCSKCQEGLLKNDDNYSCSSCNIKYSIINNVPYFYKDINTQDYNLDEYTVEIDKIANAEQNHFWFKSRRELISQVFNKFISKKNKIIEIGAGTGNIARMLSNEGYDLSIGEIHPNGIEYALKKNNSNLSIYQFDIMHNPFKNHFDVVGLFDVLEHIEDDKLAINNISKMLKRGGKIILTVPAHMWLWCEEDDISNHFKRYELDNLKELLKDEGFIINYATNFFISIVPLLYLRTKNKSSDEITINPIINFILSIISNIENKILKFISSKIGGSIIIVAEKNND